jgi:CRISPR-associated endonuclease Cas2
MILEDFDTIVAYDVGQKRLPKVYRYLSERLHWRQNSVFTGTIGKRGIAKIAGDLEDLIDPLHDSVVFYQLVYPFSVRVEYWGARKDAGNLIV